MTSIWGIPFFPVYIAVGFIHDPTNRFEDYPFKKAIGYRYPFPFPSFTSFKFEMQHRVSNSAHLHNVLTPPGWRGLSCVCEQYIYIYILEHIYYSMQLYIFFEVYRYTIYIYIFNSIYYSFHDIIRPICFEMHRTHFLKK